MRIISGYYDDSNNIILICREGDKKIKKIVSNFKPYFLIKQKDRFNDVVLRFEKQGIISSIHNYGDYCKLFINYVKNVGYVRDTLENEGIKTYESDIPFVRKYMIDNLVPIGNDPLKFLFIDIETDDTSQKIDVGAYPILSIGCVDQEGNERFFVSNDNEKNMLNEFLNYAQNYDVLVSWNGFNFDYPYIERRLALNQVYFDMRYFQKVDLMEEYKSRKSSSSYSLEFVSRSELNEGKIKHKEKIVELWKNNKEKLKEYNLNDCRLMKKLDEKLNILAFLDTMSSKTNCFIEELRYNSIIVDTCILRKIRELNLNIKFPYRGKQEKKVFEGGFVLEPELGLHKNIIVMDFLSLYNRIMQTFNISVETLNTGNERIIIPGSEVTFSKDKKGIIPLILEELEKEREYYKELRNKSEPHSEEFKKYDMLQYSVKTILLSFYGVMGSNSSRYYHNDIAGSVTQVGRYLIKLSKSIIEDKGFKVLYIDTDSLFIVVDESDLDKIIELGNKLTVELNNFYFRILETFNIPPENRKIEIKFEKVISKIIFIGDEKKTSKKRYAGLQIWSEGKKTDKLIVRGLEFVRSDWIEITRKLQKEVIEMIFNNKTSKEIKEFLLNKREDVINERLTKEELTITQTLVKPVNEYKTDIPHIKVAKQMIANGDEVWIGMKIPYILIKGEKTPIPIPADTYEKGYDYICYWNQKIYPAIERILRSVFKDIDWDELYIAKERKTKTKNKLSKNQTKLFN